MYSGHSILAEIEEGTIGDFIIEATKPSTRDRVIRRFQYENPGHHDPTGGKIRYNPQKSLLPDNHIELFQNSIPYINQQKKTIRYAKDSSGNIHRFETSVEGVYHWSGSTSGVTLKGKKRPLEVPSEVKRQLR